VQGAKAPSSRHWNALSGSLATKLKLAVVWFVTAGGPGLVIVVFGGVRSITQVCVAGLASVFPAGSVARTSKVWGPAPSPE
jgi:hypothetical protein